MFGTNLLTSGGWYNDYAFFPDVAFLHETHTTVLGDVDGDGLSELLCSVEDRATKYGAADGWLLAGSALAQGAVLDQSDAFGVLSRSTTGYGGVAGTGLGDLDGDGLGEAVIDAVLFTGEALSAGPAWSDGINLNQRGIACDLDGDGLAEQMGEDVLVGADLANGTVNTWAAAIPPAHACVGDLDGDGRQDYASASYNEP